MTARRKLVESIDRGEVTVARDTFEAFWDRILEEKRPYVTTGSHEDLSTHGRKRLLPTFGEKRISHVDEDLVRGWLADMAEAVALVRSRTPLKEVAAELGVSSRRCATGAARAISTSAAQRA